MHPDGSRKYSHEEFPESYVYALEKQTDELLKNFQFQGIEDFKKAMAINSRVEETLKNLTKKSEEYPENADEFETAFEILSEVQQKLVGVLRKN